MWGRAPHGLLLCSNRTEPLQIQPKMFPKVLEFQEPFFKKVLGENQERIKLWHF
jgi:hypothetical protein